MYHDNAFQYDTGKPVVLYWVEPNYRQAFQQFGSDFCYSMILADDDLRQVAADVIDGRFLHLVLGQEVGDREYRDDTITTNGEKLITLLEHIFHPLNLEQGRERFKIPSVLMRPWLPKADRFMTGSDVRAIFPPLWPNLDQTLKEALRYGYGQTSQYQPGIQQNPAALSNFKFPYDLQKIFSVENYPQLLDAFRTR